MTTSRQAIEMAIPLAHEWDQAGQKADVIDIRNVLRNFETEHHVRRTVKNEYPPEVAKTLEHVFAELSTYGSHTNPQTVFLRISLPSPGTANLGFVTVGKPGANHFCLLRILHLVKYVLSEYFDGFGEYLVEALHLVAGNRDFQEMCDGITASAPAGLSLYV